MDGTRLLANLYCNGLDLRFLVAALAAQGIQQADRSFVFKFERLVCNGPRFAPFDLKLVLIIMAMLLYPLRDKRLSRFFRDAKIGFCRDDGGDVSLVATSASGTDPTGKYEGRIRSQPPAKHLFRNACLDPGQHLGSFLWLGLEEQMFLNAWV